MKKLLEDELQTLLDLSLNFILTLQWNRNPLSEQEMRLKHVVYTVCTGSTRHIVICLEQSNYTEKKRFTMSELYKYVRKTRCSID